MALVTFSKTHPTARPSRRVIMATARRIGHFIERRSNIPPPHPRAQTACSNTRRRPRVAHPPRFESTQPDAATLACPILSPSRRKENSNRCFRSLFPFA
jgi:hypothetical protein